MVQLMTEDPVVRETNTPTPRLTPRGVVNNHDHGGGSSSSSSAEKPAVTESIESPGGTSDATDMSDHPRHRRSNNTRPPSSRASAATTPAPPYAAPGPHPTSPAAFQHYPQPYIPQHQYTPQHSMLLYSPYEGHLPPYPSILRPVYPAHSPTPTSIYPPPGSAVHTPDAPAFGTHAQYHHGALRYASPTASTPPYVGYPGYAPSPHVFQSPYMYTSPVDAEHHAHAHGAWWYLPSPATQQQQQYPAMQYQSIEQQSYPTQATTYSARQQQQQQLTHSYFAPQPQPEPLTLRGGHTVPSSSGSHHHQQQQTPQHHRSQYEQDPGPGPSHQPSHPQPPPHPHPPPLIPQSQSQSPSAHRTVVRRSYHPNPPAHRSEWVMWVGNVPSDAAYDELWRFFTSDAPNPTPTASTGTDAAANPAGVLSIFLIARSNCAFVNYASEAQLHAGIDAFHGTPLRPTDPRAQRLVCRTRYKDDDLTAGVGAQRGVGVHMKWVREHREETPPSVDGEAEQVSMSSASVSVSDEDASAARVRGAGDESGSGSGGRRKGSSSASTTSSVLARYFPKRYFILKSLSQFDLDLSVQRGLWATQKHNEGILDQAFRTSREVYLIFGVNKSGEFYGYARMAGPVRGSEYRVSWAPRGSAPASSSPARSGTGSGSGSGSANQHRPKDAQDTGKIVDGKTDKDNLFFSPREKRLVDESPLPLTDGAGADSGSGSGSGSSSGSGSGSSSRSGSSSGPGSGRGRSLSTDVLPARAGGSASTTSQQQQEQPPAYAHAPPPAAPARLPASAPSVLGRPHHSMSFSTPPMKHPTFEGALGGCVPVPAPTESSAFELDEAAPIRAIRGHVGGSGEEAGVGAGARLQAVVEEEERGAVDGEAVGGMGADWDRKETGKVKETEAEVETRRHAEQDGWGESFRVEWLCTERLPFARIRHLRNPWNHDREVKISRDGTELEPSVGEQLLAEWGMGGEAVAVVEQPPGERERRKTTTRSAPPWAPREDAGQIRP